jgi:hypothetical protein
VDVLTISVARFCGRGLGLAGIALGAVLFAAPSSAAGGGPAGGSDAAADVAVKAAFLYNFAKFTEWPALPPSAAIVLCIVRGDAIAAALVDIVKGQTISGHALEVWRAHESPSWQSCHLLYIPDSEIRKAADGLAAIKTLPVLTVSDGKDFSQGSGIVELFVEAGRMRFAINMDAAEDSGLHLSSRLLGLAKVTRNGHGS